MQTTKNENNLNSGMNLLDNEKGKSQNDFPKYEMKKGSFFIKYENEMNLSRIIEQNESHLSPNSIFQKKLGEEKIDKM